MEDNFLSKFITLAQYSSFAHKSTELFWRVFRRDTFMQFFVLQNAHHTLEQKWSWKAKPKGLNQ